MFINSFFSKEMLRGALSKGRDGSKNFQWGAAVLRGKILLSLILRDIIWTYHTPN